MREACLNQTELATWWKISPRTLEQWLWVGEGPQFLKFGGRMSYRIEDVEVFERAALSATGAQYRKGWAPRDCVFWSSLLIHRYQLVIGVLILRYLQRPHDRVTLKHDLFPPN